FQIPEGLKWSDGTPLLASHFTDGFKRLLNPKVGSSYAFFLEDLDPAGIRVTSETTFEIRLKRPLPYLPAILSHWTTYPVRQDLINKYDDYGNNPQHMAFLGAFRIQDWQHALRMILVPNPNSATKPYFQRVEAWIIPDDNTAINLFDTGHLEFMTDPGLLPADRKDLRNEPSPILYFIGIKDSHPLTRSKEGIAALSLALNRTEIPAALSSAHRITRSFCPPELWRLLGAEPSAGDPASFDPTAAKELLKKAGLFPAHNLPPLKLRYFDRPAIRQLAEWIQAQWSTHLGIRVELENQDPKTYWSTFSRSPSPTFLNSKGASYPDPDAFFRLFTTGNPQNLGRGQEADYDSWVREASVSSTQTRRLELYRKASERVLTEKPALIPLYFRNTQYLIKPFVKDIVINPLTGVDFSTRAHY
ncbi:MAG: peptide ABC transporter substrate-binding protein, partial [Bdellovibrionota bacterium]